MARNKTKILDGSGNVFADIALEQPEEAAVKAQIVDTIAGLLGGRGVTQKEAAILVQLTQPQILRLMRGDTRDFSYERLMRVLMALGQDVEITIRPSRDPHKHGHMFVCA